MIRCFFLLLTVFLSLFFLAPAPGFADASRPWVVSLGMNVQNPRESDDWDGGYGGEVQIQKWFGEEFAIALTLGQETWDLKPTRKTATGTKDFNIDRTSVTGDVDMTPVGASLLWRSPGNKRKTIMLNFELGVQTVDVDPNGRFVVAASKGGETVVRSESLSSGSGFNTKVAVDAEWLFGPGFELFGGIGYQFNVSKPEIDARIEAFGGIVTAGDIRGSDEVTLDSFFGRFGVRKRF